MLRKKKEAGVGLDSYDKLHLELGENKRINISKGKTNKSISE
jgi:hypothetical protein